MFKEFFSKLFAPVEIEHGTGALENPEDPRDIPASAVQDTGATLPKRFITDISHMPVLDQGLLGACVGHAMGYVVIFFEWLEQKKLIKVTPRFIYGLAKQRDGKPDDEGTYPRVGASIVKDDGCATESTLANDVKLSHTVYTQFELTDKIRNDALPRRVKGYVFPELTLDGIRAAIVQNGFVTASLKYGNWRQSPVKPLDEKGRHYIFIYGYDSNGSDTRFYFLNSWGSDWGDEGKGYFLWSDFADNIRDVIAYTDIPNTVLEEYKAKWPYKNFSPNEVKGLDLKLVDKLQAMRDLAGIPIKIVSGLRSKEKNEDVGGVPDSAHTKGLAVDIECIGSRANYILTKAAYAVGFRRIGDGGARNFLHLDIDSTKDQDVKWHY